MLNKEWEGELEKEITEIQKVIHDLGGEELHQT